MASGSRGLIQASMATTIEITVYAGIELVGRVGIMGTSVCAAVGIASDTSTRGMGSSSVSTGGVSSSGTGVSGIFVVMQSIFDLIDETRHDVRVCMSLGS